MGQADDAAGWWRALVQTVPPDLAWCEFECRAATCTAERFDACNKRLEYIGRGVHPCGVASCDPQASEGREFYGDRCERRTWTPDTYEVYHDRAAPAARTRPSNSSAPTSSKPNSVAGEVNSWWLKSSKIQKQEFCGAPLLAIKFLDGICSDCGSPCLYCLHRHVATVCIFLEKDKGNPFAPFDAISARSPANARARIEEEMKREDTISQVACIVYCPP